LFAFYRFTRGSVGHRYWPMTHVTHWDLLTHDQLTHVWPTDPLSALICMFRWVSTISFVIRVTVIRATFPVLVQWRVCVASWLVWSRRRVLQNIIVFAATRCYASAAYAVMRCLSLSLSLSLCVCLSVRLSRSWILSIQVIVSSNLAKLF